jgi:hypothetical protein
MEGKILVNKLAEVMEEVKYIQKRGKNAHFNYTYAMEADVADKVREALAKRCVVMIPSLVEHSLREIETRNGKQTVAMVVMEYTFHDGESGETLSFKMPGEGQDSGDKAFYKAITGSGKYAMMKAFLIPTGDDPENDENGDNGKQNGKKDGADGKPTGKDDTPADSKDLRKAIGDMIMEMCEGDKNLAGDILEKHTAYTKDGKQYSGKRSLKDVSDKALAPTYGRVKEAYTAWQMNTGRLIA